MKSALFAELLGAANDALEHVKGKRDLRSTVLPKSPEPMTAEEVRDVRDKLHASQAVFARYLNVSTKLVQAWEADERAPSGPALVLLRVIYRQPGIVDLLHARNGASAPATAKSRRRVAAKR